jgi:predicted membrane protein
MKIIKLFTPLLFLCATSKILSAQEYKIQVENTKTTKLVLNDLAGDFPVEGYSGNEIIITSTSDRFTKTPERAKGLKPVYALGTDNTGIGLKVEKQGNIINVHSLLPITQREVYKVRVPNNLAINIRTGCALSGTITIRNINNEVEINNCSSINIKAVTGPLVLSTIHGDINVVVSNLNKDKPTSIASVSGNIDVTLPVKTAADVEMGTISGSVYTDFDLTESKDKMRRIGGSNIKNSLNGGGAELKISNVSGNIYLRKG